MALTTSIKNGLNRLLRFGGLRLDTLTGERIEQRRVEALVQKGYFGTPAFPLLPAFRGAAYQQILAELPRHQARFNSLRNVQTNDVQFTFGNDFFSSPDAEVLYTMVRKFAPRRILEIGCGNSTRISRQAIQDGGLDTRLTCIDPRPRTEIRPFADEIHLERVESLAALESFRALSPGDFLFIDSSHELRVGNDCVFLYLRALHEVAPGVIVHVHDVYLPYDYPPEYLETQTWAEQYLVNCLLAGRQSTKVLWAGHYLSRTMPDFFQHFRPVAKPRAATSLWFQL